MRLGDLAALKEHKFVGNKFVQIGGRTNGKTLKSINKAYQQGWNDCIDAIIDNAPTVEVPENEVNCVLTMFGKCSYNKTGCSDCEIKDKIRKALNEGPQGEWIDHSEDYGYAECPFCHELTNCDGPIDELHYCWYCGSKLGKGGAKMGDKEE